jgi:hypothetical protein
VLNFNSVNTVTAPARTDDIDDGDGSDNKNKK